jgi:hypothetical protein
VRALVSAHRHQVAKVPIQAIKPRQTCSQNRDAVRAQKEHT